MARGNQRDKAREKAQKAAAGTVSQPLLKTPTELTLMRCRNTKPPYVSVFGERPPCRTNHHFSLHR